MVEEQFPSTGGTGGPELGPYDPGRLWDDVLGQLENVKDSLGEAGRRLWHHISHAGPPPPMSAYGSGSVAAHAVWAHHLALAFPDPTIIGIRLFVVMLVAVWSADARDQARASVDPAFAKELARRLALQQNFVIDKYFNPDVPAPFRHPF